VSRTTVSVDVANIRSDTTNTQTNVFTDLFIKTKYLFGKFCYNWNEWEITQSEWVRDFIAKTVRLWRNCETGQVCKLKVMNHTSHPHIYDYIFQMS